MIELFSRRPELVEPPEGGRLTRLPIADEVSSFSAILLNDDYYAFIQQGVHVRDGLSVLTPEYIVPLKARAWIDLRGRHERGGGRLPRRHQEASQRHHPTQSAHLAGRTDHTPRVDPRGRGGVRGAGVA